MQQTIIDTYTALAPAFDEGSEGANDLLYGDFVLHSIEPSMQNALEVGCGVGRLALQVARTVPHVLAIDITPDMIDRARRRAVQNGVEFVVADVHEYKFDSTFDLIYSILAFDTCNRQAVLPKLRSLLRPNGVMIILDRFTWDQGAPTLGDFSSYLQCRSQHHLPFNLPKLLWNMPRMMRLLSHPAWQNPRWKALGDASGDFKITAEQYRVLVEDQLPKGQFEMMDKNTALITYRACP